MYAHIYIRGKKTKEKGSNLIAQVSSLNKIVWEQTSQKNSTLFLRTYLSPNNN